ncbi:MAG: hypothetical protein J6I98_05480 [Clostridia bacterium]|nr:hypothetical protein [Clostridia bacterium]
MKYILGIDQGGSKTHAAVAAENGEILGIGTGSGACHASTGMEYAMAAVLDAAQQACAQAGISLQEINRVGAGLTGVDWDFEGPLLQENLHKTLSVPLEKIHVVNDCLIALRAASSKPAGCILCVGSGMNCGVRRDAQHEYVYGYYVDDACQGGSALGRRVVQAVLDSEAGLLPKTALTAPVLEQVGCKSVDEMLFMRVNGTLDDRKVLHLPEVLEQVILQTGDPVAVDVLCTFGRDIAKYVTAGLRRFDMLNDDVEVVLSGSVFKCRARELLDTVRAEILAAAPNIRIIESEYEPIVGSVLLALDDMYTVMDNSVLEQVHKTVIRHGLLRKQKSNY